MQCETFAVSELCKINLCYSYEKVMKKQQSKSVFSKEYSRDMFNDVNLMLHCPCVVWFHFSINMYSV